MHLRRYQQRRHRQRRHHKSRRKPFGRWMSLLVPVLMSLVPKPIMLLLNPRKLTREQLTISFVSSGRGWQSHMPRQSSKFWRRPMSTGCTAVTKSRMVRYGLSETLTTNGARFIGSSTPQHYTRDFSPLTSSYTHSGSSESACSWLSNQACSQLSNGETVTDTDDSRRSVSGSCEMGC